MKKYAARMIVALLVCALSGSIAFAKTKVRSSTATFGVDFMVGDTLVKKGTYKLSFDIKKSELTVIAKDKTVVAKTIAHFEARTSSSLGMEVMLAQKGANQSLVSVAFPGMDKNIVLDAGGSQAALAPQ